MGFVQKEPKKIVIGGPISNPRLPSAANCRYDVVGGTKYECNGYCVHDFTSNGTLTVN